MRTVLIRGEITAEHVQALWDAVATAEDGEKLGVVLDNCTGAQPWAMYAAHYAIDNYQAGQVWVYVRGQCLSAGLQVLTATSWAWTSVTADREATFLPHGAPENAAGGRRRNAWQAARLAFSCCDQAENWLQRLVTGDQPLTAEEAVIERLVARIGPPPDWAVPLLEDGGEAA